MHSTNRTGLAEYQKRIEKLLIMTMMQIKLNVKL